MYSSILIVAFAAVSCSPAGLSPTSGLFTSRDDGSTTTGSFRNGETFVPANEEALKSHDLIFVTPDAGPGLQEAINSAVDGDTIEVAPGTYYGNFSFMGKAVYVRGSDGPEVTVLDGNGTGSVVSFVSEEDTNSVLDGFSVRNGAGTRDGNRIYGGGIYMINSAGTVRNSIIKDNYVGDMTEENNGRGGGGYISNSKIVMENCILENNRSGYGGGFYLIDCSGRMIGSVFQNNQAQGIRVRGDYWSGSGGACYMKDCSWFTCYNNKFITNLAKRYDQDTSSSRGGAIFISHNEATIRNNQFCNNWAVYGAAIAVIGGGGYQRPLLIHNLFLENSAGDEWSSGLGGGVYSWGTDGSAQARVYNNTFVGNSAGCGGCVYHTGEGGGIINNIAVGTRKGTAMASYYADQRYNCYWENAEGDTWEYGEGALLEDPLISENTNWHLPEESPCIDAGFDLEITGLEDEHYYGEAFDMGFAEWSGPVLPGYKVLNNKLRLSADSLFAPVRLGGSYPHDTLVVENEGILPLWYEVEARSGAWLALSGVLSDTLLPGESNSIAIEYLADTLSCGLHCDTIDVWSDDPRHGLVEVPVTAAVYTRELFVPGVFPTIQSAIDIAVAGDSVLVAPGTYTGEGFIGLDLLGKGITVRTAAGLELAVLDCEGTDRAVNFVSGEDSTTVFERFVIRNGFAYDWFGGGILCDESSPVIRDCVITDCTAEQDGGGISCDWGAPLIKNCVLTRNDADFGGGIYTYNGETVIDGCTIYENYGYGGGICAEDCFDLLITNTLTFSNHSSDIIFHGGTAELTFSTNADPCFVDAEADDYRLLPWSPCIDTGDPESPVSPWGGARRDIGAYEYDFGWYVDGAGDIIRKPSVSGITTFLDDHPDCFDFGVTVALEATVINTDISDRPFDHLLFILDGVEADTFIVTDSLVVLTPGDVVLYPFDYPVPADFPHGLAVCRVEARHAGTLLHETGGHTKVSICSHNMNDIED